jgi:hypothetical protein
MAGGLASGWARAQASGYKKESPDVETPGLLVKALISSFFMVVVVAHLTNIFFKILPASSEILLISLSLLANIAGKKHTNKRY